MKRRVSVQLTALYDRRSVGAGFVFDFRLRLLHFLGSVGWFPIIIRIGFTVGIKQGHVVPNFTRQSDVRKRGHVVPIFTHHADVRKCGHVVPLFTRQSDVRNRGHVVPMFP